MRELVRTVDAVTLTLICDALQQKSVDFHVDHVGISSLLPLPGVMDARIMVDEADYPRARQILNDLEGMDHS